MPPLDSHHPETQQETLETIMGIDRAKEMVSQPCFNQSKRHGFRSSSLLTLSTILVPSLFRLSLGGGDSATCYRLWEQERENSDWIVEIHGTRGGQGLHLSRVHSI